MDDYSKNIVTDIIGNGMPHSESQYGKRYWIGDNSRGLYLCDVGYAQIFAR